MKTKTVSHILLTMLVIGVSPRYLKADETLDLVQTIIQSSPVEKSRASKFKASSPKASANSSSVPNMGIPENQLLNVDEKFPKDYVGKYVYGRVSFKDISERGGDVRIGFTAKGYRMFSFYTKDPGTIRAFSQCGWGTKFNIPKECPLKIVGKDFTFYVLRLPFDQDTTTHSMGENLQQRGNNIQNIIQDTANRLQNDLKGVPNQ
jgi:hypothetical protein